MPRKPNPIPEGHRTITPTICVRGALAALAFYRKAFGAKLLFSMLTPDKKKVMHAEFSIGDSIVMLFDEAPGAANCSPKQAGCTTGSLHLYLPRVDAAFRKAVKAGAKILMPPTDMFWGDRFAIVRDPFGHAWGMATHCEDVTPAEMARRLKSGFGPAPKK